MARTKQKFSDLDGSAQAGITLLGIGQVALAVAAFIGLARTPKRRVRGPKAVWIPVILVNWIGPIAFFLVGRKR
ncbi:PLDc N-terminal domain-containing protein [Curtobacterium ammoniigenes]|uniref:PLDc N-terminal domain-containing protein n=1 Tax=Curtobacterium ammoniigenes TaxID=395387 RepID=UPI000836355E|nr:PLDc N-terminal domain-containing protein [Curtobacterium ammoniigenes]